VNWLKRAAFGLAGRCIAFRRKSAQPILYLTFDDGPHELHTPALLEVLARLGVRASFFLVGKSAAAHPQIVTAIVAAGHTLGNHSFHHRKRSTMSSAVARSEIEETDAVLARFDGRVKHPFRPPWGEVPPLQLLRCIFRLDYLVLWSRDSLDYKEDAAAIVAGFRRSPPTPGDIILFHDDAAVAVETLSVLIPEWRSHGFCFEPLPRANDTTQSPPAAAPKR
jgi:peptidoglycan-N-acetylglucosamine deacetylase